MQWHTLPADAPLQKTDEFEVEALKKTKLFLSYVPPRYRSSYFLHIWGGDYGAGYYAYLWSEMLDNDAFQWFEEHGGLTRANGDRLRRMVLSRGNTEELGKMYAAWLGQSPASSLCLSIAGWCRLRAQSRFDFFCRSRCVPQSSTNDFNLKSA